MRRHVAQLKDLFTGVTYSIWEDWNDFTAEVRVEVDKNYPIKDLNQLREISKHPLQHIRYLDIEPVHLRKEYVKLGDWSVFGEGNYILDLQPIDNFEVFRMMHLCKVYEEALKGPVEKVNKDIDELQAN